MECHADIKRNEDYTYISIWSDIPDISVNEKKQQKKIYGLLERKKS